MRGDMRAGDATTCERDGSSGGDDAQDAARGGRGSDCAHMRDDMRASDATACERDGSDCADSSGSGPEGDYPDDDRADAQPDNEAFQEGYERGWEAALGDPDCGDDCDRIARDDAACFNNDTFQDAYERGFDAARDNEPASDANLGAFDGTCSDCGAYSDDSASDYCSDDCSDPASDG